MLTLDESSNELASLLERAGPHMGRLLAQPEHHRVQILLTRLMPNTTSSTRSLGFRVDREYFYPASTIKLAASLCACEVLGELERAWGCAPGELLAAPMRIHPCLPGQELVESTTVLREVRRIMLVSDNPAHNRLVELVGHRGLNERCWKAGLTSIRLHHRLSAAYSLDENKRSGRVELCVHGAWREASPERTSTLALEANQMPGVVVGLAHITDGERVDAPMSFAFKNRVSLVDLHRLVLMGAAPKLAQQMGMTGFALAPEHEAAIASAMEELPGDSADPVYPRSEFPDTYAKYLLRGLRRVRPAREWRIANKVGQAYGFTLENAIVTHVPTGAAACVTATMFTCASEVLNADEYEYTTLALPAMGELGTAVGAWMLG